MFESKGDALLHLQFSYNLIIISFLKPKALFFWRRKGLKKPTEEQARYV